MDKQYDHTKYEADIYNMWEKGGHFDAHPKGTPYTILMPPPNANASLHAGHAMYSIDDILVRWKRMQGFHSQWLPGMDHAGFETQYVYEKHLRKEGKSRLDFDRKTLYDNVYTFVQENSGLIFSQMKRLGFSANWKRSVFTLDEHVVERVFSTFQKMEKEGLVYRDDYIVNYCTYCGTSLAELEVKYVEREDVLYYVRYPLVDPQKSEKEYVEVATVRPEPIYADTHLAIHPKNKKTTWLKGRKVRNPVTNKEMPVIEDEFVDPEFGTGVVKLTPAHDPHDFEVAKKHKLPIVQAINNLGRMMGGPYEGEKVNTAREKTIADLKEKGLINEKKTDEKYMHSVITCYKCGRDLEPLTIPNWFIRVKELKQPVIDAVKADKVNFYPGKYKKHMLDWLEIMHDWPISRQIVWGIRIPVWYKVTGNEDKISVSFIDKKGNQQLGPISQHYKNGYKIDEIREGLQQIIVPIFADQNNQPEYQISKDEPTGKDDWIPETDTFDTWFSSGQWPLVTLSQKEYKTMLPTNVMGTLSDILKFWVSRMILFSLYLEKKMPFGDVYLWSMVADSKGVKMSKSKGNVVNPIDLVDKYGADALRMALIYGVAPGAKVPLSDDKVRGMRNFGNKLWNMARFMNIMFDKHEGEVPMYSKDMQVTNDDDAIIKSLENTIKKVDAALTKYRFAEAGETIYHFMWEDVANTYLESIKDRKDMDVALSVLRHVYINGIKLLHPFMPFITEAIWPNIPGIFQKPFKREPLIVASWPTIK